MPRGGTLVQKRDRAKEDITCRVKLIEGAIDYILYQWHKNLKAIVAFLDEGSEGHRVHQLAEHTCCVSINLEIAEIEIIKQNVSII